MIRYGGRTEDGRALVGLALGGENIRRLEGGEPIMVDGRTVGAPGVVIVISAAESSQKAIDELKRVALEAGARIEELDAMLVEAGIDQNAVPEKKGIG